MSPWKIHPTYNRPYINLQLTHQSISEWLKENFYYNKSTLISFALMSEGQDLDSTCVAIVQEWRVYLYSWLWRTNILICNLCPNGEKYLIWTFSNILDFSDILSKKKIGQEISCCYGPCRPRTVTSLHSVLIFKVNHNTHQGWVFESW